MHFNCLLLWTPSPLLAHSSYLINVGWMNEWCPHVTEQTSYLSKSLIPLKRSWVPFCRQFEFSSNRTRVANRSLSSSEPICSLWQLSHSPWILLDDPSLLQREVSPCFSFYSLIPVLLFTLVFKPQHTCSFPMHHCTDVIWPYPWYADAVLYFVMFPVFCLFYHGYIPMLLVQVTSSCLLFKNHIIQYF